MNQHRVLAQTAAIILFVALIAGLPGARPANAAGLKLNSPLAAEGDVLDFAISPDGEYVVYRAGTGAGDATELYSVPLAGGEPVLLSGSLPWGRAIEADYQVSPDSSRVVFRAPGDAPGTIGLYSAPIAGPGDLGTDGPPALFTQLTGPLAGRSKVTYFHIAPDSSRVVYRADTQASGTYELFSVPLAGPSTAAVKLNGPMVAGGNVYHSFVSAEGGRVVYLADQQVNEVLELYSVAIAGPASEGVKLSGSMAAGGDVTSFLVSPDGKRVVYQADQQTDGISELWAVPIDGPAAAGVKLNGDLVEMGNVQSFLVTADGARVLYLADQQVDNVWELFGVPITGPAGAGVQLSGALVDGGDVSWFSASADGSRAIYLADREKDDVQELYSVPAAGPASAGVKLSTRLADGGNVVSAELSQDGSVVVYRADAYAEDVYELFSVPSAGPATAGVRLNAELPPDGDVVSFQISPDSRYVVYIADQDVDGVDALYRVPIAGPAGAAVELGGSAKGSVWSFQIAPDGRQVVYRADLDATGVDELYAAAGE